MAILVIEITRVFARLVPLDFQVGPGSSLFRSFSDLTNSCVEVQQFHGVGGQPLLLGFLPVEFGHLRAVSAVDGLHLRVSRAVLCGNYAASLAAPMGRTMLQTGLHATILEPVAEALGTFERALPTIHQPCEVVLWADSQFCG